MARIEIDRPPRLKDRARSTAISIVTGTWFVCAGILLWSFFSTLITPVEYARIATWVIAIVASVLLLVSKRLELDGWAAFLFGFFGLLPAGLALIMLMNHFIGPTEEISIPITGIVQHHNDRTSSLRLPNEAFEEYRTVMLDLPKDPDVWYASSVRFEMRHGFFGYDVLLDRSIILSQPHVLLPEFNER